MTMCGKMDLNRFRYRVVQGDSSVEDKCLSGLMYAEDVC